MSLEEDSNSEPVEQAEESIGNDFQDEEDGVMDDIGEEEADNIAVGRGSGESSALYNANDVNEEVFEELHLGDVVAQEVQSVWSQFLRGAESREAAGEAIYSALFDAAPSLQALFKTPRAVMAMRFMAGLNSMVLAAHDPKELKTIVETLGFQHLELEVTSPRVGIFRDAIVDLLSEEVGDALTARARDGWCTFLNYIGGAYIYVRVKYAERLTCLATSWAAANGKVAEGDGEEGEEEDPAAAAEELLAAASNDDKAKRKDKGSKSWFGSKSKMGSSGGGGATMSGEAGYGKNFQNAAVPKTFMDMFLFNAAVMGFGAKVWMHEILSSFDNIVLNVANSGRLQEECDVLALRMAKYKGTITLSEYKAVMLASLRSLVKEWSSGHEVSWSWLWANIERMLKAQMGKPARQEAALSAFLASLDESSLMYIRTEVYSKFFSMAPAGQDYFKQSTTRLHFIADKVVSMTLDMYREPKRLVEDISAMGLRHVGYGIPTDLFGPFVTACVQVVRTLTNDDLAEESFRWSLSLVSRILTRVITEGSTIVMKAINANSGKLLRKAVSCAPRGQRALWMLNVQVGTQSISPLLWAIEAGSLDAAKGIIKDLLTIRADRDRYYYGNDILFERHPDIIKRLCLDAPALMPDLLDGLIWRSRVTENGRRRVNYYIKHLIVDADGAFAPAIEWVTDSRDPKIVCHPLLSMVTDLVWSRVAFRTFLNGKAWFLFTLIIFVLAQSILNNLRSEDGNDEASDSVRKAVFACRVFIYIFSMGQCLYYHAKKSLKDIKARNMKRFGYLKLPEYLFNWQDLASVFLTIFLVLMLCLEPILHCLSSAGGDRLFTSFCPEGEDLIFAYSVMSTAAMLFYFLLLTDLSVFSNQLSAYVLVCGLVLSELVLFLFGLTFFVLAFACAISALEQDNKNFSGITKSSLELYKVTFAMFSGASYDALSDSPALLVAVLMYVVTTVIFLLNLLIAQLNGAYSAAYLDMLGFARLNRGKIVAETMPSVSKARWLRFLEGLRLDERVEFGEGDIGLAGGVQVFEPASANITTVDMIRRFGGSTSAAAQWPEDDMAGVDDEDRFERLEKVIEKAMKKMSSSKRRSGAGSSGGPSSMMSSALGASSDSASQAGDSG
eukprot:CAMPEP_0176107138 /NCGR_PEP_ID=MMETSP0120_2-20121206/53766_1 /TAXON_ID=160619 /ORGANISM="Kryptoperidinium foliaceum, Strain CCMP 1326" /LENGTH=1123 /DNA_ID=CAMNT_0017441265 /DNA_START=66 /DNA_END=3437 /DNA_ORIENTATION=-